jgi:HEAT repeat protein
MGSTSPAGLPDELVRALAPLRALVHGPRNSVLPIVGSGLSSGALPSWWRLLDDLIGEAEPDLQPELRELLAKDRYLDVASLLEDSAAGKARVLTYMKRTFARPAAPPPSIYADVAALPVDHFATTNYDPWLKDAVARARSLAPRVYVPSDEAAFADLAASSDPLVLMLHGDAARPSTCVLSQRAYRKLQFLPAYRAGMAALAAHRTLLFIGHSLSDPDLLAVLAEWGELVGGPVTTPRHYFLGVGLDRATRLRLAELGVTPIEYGAKGDHRLLPAVLTHLAAPVTAPAAPPSTPRVAARPRVLLAGPHFGLPTVVRQTLEANKDWSAEQIRAYLTDQPELHRAHLAAILRYDLIVDASPWQGFRRWLSVGFRDLEEVLTPGFAPRDPPDATVMFLHDDAKSALETRLLDLRARFPELGARLLASAGEGLASAGVDAATRKSLKSVFDLLGGPREIAAPKAGDLVTPTAADYLRAVRVVAGQVRLPGDTDYRPLEDVFVELSLYRESPAARPPREGKPETKLEAKPDAKLEAKPDPAGETLADSGDDERALREAEARPTPEPAARVDAKGLLVAAPRAYLEGAAGTGKSTLVRWQAVLAAQAARTSAERWPLWIELSQLRTAGDLHAALLDAAFAALHLAPSGPARAELSERLSDGRVVLLLDALDEATTAARNLVVTQVVAKFPTSSLLLSSRPTEAADAVAAALMKVRLTGLTPAGTSDFLRVYFGERPWREEFLAALAGLPGGERWRETPLLLALAATHVAAGRRLPRHTLTLYDEVIDRLLERARSRVGAAPEFTAQARNKLEELAAGALLPKRVKPRVAIAPGELPSGPVGDVIRASGLFFGTSSLRFAHLTLGEYLAACGAVGAARPSRVNAPTATPDSAAQAGREETLALLDRTHCLDDEAIPIALARAGEATLTAALADARPDPDHRRLRALLRALTYGGDGAVAFGRAQGSVLAERIARAMCPPSGRYSEVERRMVRDAERALLALEEVPGDAWRAFEALHRAAWPVGLDAHLLGWALGAPWPLPPSPRSYLSGLTLRAETERLAAAFLRASPRRLGARQRREGVFAVGSPVLLRSDRLPPGFKGRGRSDPLTTLFETLANDPDSRALLRAKLDDPRWDVRRAAVAALANDPDSRALLRAKLDDPDNDVRSAAFAALANDPDSRALLRAKLDDPDNDVRSAAFAALANDPDSRALLRAKLDDPRWDVRRAAVAALANDPDSRALLRAKLDDPDNDVRSAAVAALANDPDSRALLRAKLDDPDNDVRSAAFAALANDPDSRALLRAKLDDPRWDVRRAAVAALANDPDSRALLRAKLDDPDNDVRSAAVAALANDPDSRALLRAKLDDPNEYVRSAAFAALANDPDSRALLRAKLDDPDNDVRSAAFAALANDPDSRALLRAKLDDPRWDVRSAAFAALANDPDSRALLRAKLDDPDNDVRSAAFAALANDPDSRALLRAKLDDPRWDVRSAAVAALANDPDSRALLRAKLDDPDNDVRSAAFAALANDPDSRALLRAKLDDPTSTSAAPPSPPSPTTQTPAPSSAPSSTTRAGTSAAPPSPPSPTTQTPAPSSAPSSTTRTTTSAAPPSPPSPTTQTPAPSSAPSSTTRTTTSAAPPSPPSPTTQTPAPSSAPSSTTRAGTSAAPPSPPSPTTQTPAPSSAPSSTTRTSTSAAPPSPPSPTTQTPAPSSAPSSTTRTTTSAAPPSPPSPTTQTPAPSSAPSSTTRAGTSAAPPSPPSPTTQTPAPSSAPSSTTRTTTSAAPPSPPCGPPQSQPPTTPLHCGPGASLSSPSTSLAIERRPPRRR